MSHRDVLIGVLGYLVRNPGARDAIEGIRQWWKMPGDRAWPPETLMQVLAFLETRDLVIVQEVAPGVRLYGANSQCLDEMKKFLEKVKDEAQDEHKE